MKRVLTPYSPVREREREREREKEREGKRERGRERGSKKEGERERIFILILKGMTGALAPFSYLVI